MNRKRYGPESFRRRGMTLIELLVVIAMIGVLVGMLVPAVQVARESVRKAACTNNLHQLGVALQIHNDSRRQLPTSNFGPGYSNGPRTSWATQLLPYLEKQNMYDEYNSALPWCDRNPPAAPRTLSNAQLAAIRVQVFECPSSPDLTMFDGDHQYWLQSYPSWNDSRQAAQAHFSPVVEVSSELYSFLGAPAPGDRRGGLVPNSVSSFANISDGLTNTILLAECAGRPFVYQRGLGRVGDLPTNRVNGGGWARPASDFALEGSSRDGSTIPGPCAINCTNGEDYLKGADDKSGVASQFFGPYGTGETYAFHNGGANVVFADGSVHFLNESIDIKVYAQLVTRNGHEVIQTVID